MALATTAVAATTTTLPHRHTTTTQHLLQVPSMPATATPLITATPLLNASSHDIAMLHDIHSLLNKIFVRNRNQHRRSTWWKALHGFRKQMALLLAELEGNASGAGVKRVGKEKSWEKERKEKVEARLRYWDDRGGVHGWYYQFSQLVAVGPFAMLGLVMMACVARVCRITGITSVYEEIASADVQGVLGASDELALAGEFSSVLDEGDECDEGVVVAREEDYGV